MTHEEYIIKKCVEANKDTTSKNWWKTVGLADVLLALEEKSALEWSVDSSGLVYPSNYDNNKPFVWNLHTDLHGQIDYTKELLAKALGYNE